MSSFRVSTARPTLLGTLARVPEQVTEYAVPPHCAARGPPAAPARLGCGPPALPSPTARVTGGPGRTSVGSGSRSFVIRVAAEAPRTTSPTSDVVNRFAIAAFKFSGEPEPGPRRRRSLLDETSYYYQYGSQARWVSLRLAAASVSRGRPVGRRLGPLCRYPARSPSLSVSPRRPDRTGSEPVACRLYLSVMTDLLNHSNCQCHGALETVTAYRPDGSR